ncbi:MAG: hypothetical protein AB8H03_14965, partial [Saprospiraceae bacterium]
MTTLSINELIKFSEGELSPARTKSIKEYIKKYPYYSDMIDGIKIIQEELTEDDSIEAYFEREQAAA